MSMPTCQKCGQRPATHNEGGAVLVCNECCQYSTPRTPARKLPRLSDQQAPGSWPHLQDHEVTRFSNDPKAAMRALDDTRAQRDALAEALREFEAAYAEYVGGDDVDLDRLADASVNARTALARVKGGDHAHD